MKSYLKMVILIAFAILLTIVINITVLLMVNNSINELKNYFTKDQIIEFTTDNVIKEDIQKEIEEINVENGLDENNTQEENIEQSEIEYRKIEEQDSIDEGTIVGNIIIPKINFEGKIYEGTTLEVLKKGVGHFENTPYLEGNVCLAAHNTSKFWAELKTLKKGDSIYYDSFLGTREYTVSEIIEIDETDWSRLNNTDENILTLITCIKGNKPKRLCVISKEI